MTDEALGNAFVRPETDGEHGSLAAAAGPSQRARTIGWLAFGFVAVAYLLVLMSPVGGFARFAALEVIYTTPIAISVILALRAARISSGAERRFWLFMSAANTTLVGCEVLLVWWVVAISAQGPPRISPPFHALHGIAAICFVAMLLSMSRMQDSDVATRWRIALDFFALGIVAYAVLLEVYVRPVMTGAPVSAAVLGTAYPLVGFMLLFGTLGLVVGFKFVKWRTWEMLVAVSLGVYAIAISMWPGWYMTVTDTSRNLTRGALDLVQLTGHYLLLMAAVYRLTERTASHLRPLALPAAARRSWVSLVLPGLSIVAIPALLYAALTERGQGDWFVVYAALASALIGVLMLRSLLMTVEHGALFHRSVTDPLTGLYNHRYFYERLQLELNRSRRYDDELSVIVVDVDEFGDFNLTHGHLAGDALLESLGAKLQEMCPSPLICARLGGDEFGVIVPETGLTESQLLAQRVIDMIGIECGPTPGMLSASAGLASYPQHADNGHELVRLADGALFHAKETGKACVVAFEIDRVPDLSARDRISRLESQSRLAAIRALAAAVDARDPATRFHSQQVAALSKEVGRVLGLSESRSRLLELAALMHDAGKIGLPDSVLNRRDELTESEQAEIRKHATRGEEILRSTDIVEILPWVRGHHERWDGAGYPDGLQGEDIPLEARILSVCDAFDAITSDRAYHTALPPKAALAEIASASGTQFDPCVVTALRQVVSGRVGVPFGAKSQVAVMG